MEWNFRLLEAGFEITLAISRDLARSVNLQVSVRSITQHFRPAGIGSCFDPHDGLMGSCDPDYSDAMPGHVD